MEKRCVFSPFLKWFSSSMERKASGKNDFLRNWRESLNSSIARIYSTFKSDIIFEKYLLVVKNLNHRKALAQLRCSSHHLRVETGRWSHKEISLRICPSCRVLEDERHFVCDCRINNRQRAELSNFIFSNICSSSATSFADFKSDLFVNLLTTSDENLLRSFARFCYSSFQIRKELYE